MSFARIDPRQDTPLWAIFLFLGIGTAALLGSWQEASDDWHYWRSSERVAGRVVDPGHGRRGGYFPVVGYEWNGSAYTVRAEPPSWPSEPRLGERVTVLVARGGPSGARLARFAELGLRPLIVATVGIGFLGLSIALSRRRARLKKHPGNSLWA